jgi:hypothetical protein
LKVEYIVTFLLFVTPTICAFILDNVKFSKRTTLFDIPRPFTVKIDDVYNRVHDPPITPPAVGETADVSTEHVKDETSKKESSSFKLSK